MKLHLRRSPLGDEHRADLLEPERVSVDPRYVKHWEWYRKLVWIKWSAFLAILVVAAPLGLLARLFFGAVVGDMVGRYGGVSLFALSAICYVIQAYFICPRCGTTFFAGWF